MIHSNPEAPAILKWIYAAPWNQDGQIRPDEERLAQAESQSRAGSPVARSFRYMRTGRDAIQPISASV